MISVLCDVDLPLKPLNVMIGSNGSGKTLLLDVFSFLAVSASGHLNETVSAFGGVESNLSTLEAVNAGKTEIMQFKIGAAIPNSPSLEAKSNSSAGRHNVAKQ